MGIRRPGNELGEDLITRIGRWRISRTCIRRFHPELARRPGALPAVPGPTGVWFSSPPSKWWTTDASCGFNEPGLPGFARDRHLQPTVPGCRSFCLPLPHHNNKIHTYPLKSRLAPRPAAPNFASRKPTRLVQLRVSRRIRLHFTLLSSQWRPLPRFSPSRGGA